MNSKTHKSIAVIVAHPDDETLWAGGTILEHPSNSWFIVCLCRASDPERAERFNNTLKILKADGIMGDIDDGPDQHPLNELELENEILRLLPKTDFDLIITHDSAGEYTKHLRHQEVNKAVVNMWHDEKITANELWTFAYEDGNKAYFPKAIESANIFESLSEKIWMKKYKLITQTYGFAEKSWEAETTPLEEAFWQFKSPHKAIKSLLQFEDEVKMSKLSMFKLLYNDCFGRETENFANETKITCQVTKKAVSFFKTQDIETLKSSNYESISIV